jgi:hypothetical protein
MMTRINRRQFLYHTLAGLGLSGMGPTLRAADAAASLLPTVRWGNHDLTRLLMGHNPIKGVSHLTGALSQEMRDYFAADPRRSVNLLRRCEEMGINACQVGYRPSERFIEEMLRRHHAEGGRLKWIASFYSAPQEREEVRKELDHLLNVTPRPIGVQQVGNTSDWLMRTGQIDLTSDNLKRFRDSGLLVGLGAHNHEVIDYAESKGWDVDFYQCAFYRSVFSLQETGRARELFEEEARESMTRTIRQVAKPCLAFKVLGAGRHCQSAETIERALRYAFDHIKPSDVVLLGMWQKHQDQIGDNARLVRKILTAA